MQHILLFVVFNCLNIALGTMNCTFSKNLALGKPANASSQHDSNKTADLVVDGNLNWPCLITLKSAYSWWQIDLQHAYNVSAIVVTSDAALGELEIYFSPEVKSDQSWEQLVDIEHSFCYSYKIEDRTGIYKCNGTVDGRYMRIYRNPKEVKRINICEVQVYETMDCDVEATTTATISTAAIAQHSNETSSDSNLCSCSCHTTQWTNESLKQYLDELRKANTVLKHETSKYIRKLVCASDDRSSSFTIGTFGISLLVAVACLVLLNDFVSFIMRIRGYKATK